LALDLLDLVEELEVDAVGVVDRPGGVGAADDDAAELVDLLDGEVRHVAGARDQHPGAVEAAAAGGEHVLGEEDGAVARGLGAHDRAAPVQTLAGDDAGLVAVGHALVLTEQVTDLAYADADVAGRDVDVLTDVAVQLG